MHDLTSKIIAQEMLYLVTKQLKERNGAPLTQHSTHVELEAQAKDLGMSLEEFSARYLEGVATDIVSAIKKTGISNGTPTVSKDWNMPEYSIACLLLDGVAIRVLRRYTIDKDKLPLLISAYWVGGKS